MVTRTHIGSSGLQAHDPIHGRGTVGTDPQALPQSPVGMQPLHVSLGGGGSNDLLRDYPVAQLAARPLVVLPRIHGVS